MNDQSRFLPPTIIEAHAVYEESKEYLVKTPVISWSGLELQRLLGEETQVFAKLEFLQKPGSFKVRGALSVVLSHTAAEIERGVTSFSSGNHAVAVSYLAQQLGVPAKLFMLKSANVMRRKLCEQFGAEFHFGETSDEIERMAHDYAKVSGRILIHPWEGRYTSLGTAGVGLELYEQIPKLDAVVMAIGGGGLCSGVGPIMKQLNPKCEILAVEPEGAPTIYESIRAGHPITLASSKTIADALAPPFAKPYSFAMCRDYVDEVALVSDDEIRAAMKLIFRDLRLAVEPACAAATAGLVGPFRERLKGKRVAVMLCGSNIDLQSYIRVLGEDVFG